MLVLKTAGALGCARGGDDGANKRRHGLLIALTHASLHPYLIMPLCHLLVHLVSLSIRDLREVSMQSLEDGAKSEMHPT